MAFIRNVFTDKDFLFLREEKCNQKKLRLKKGCSSQCQVFSTECCQHVDLSCLRPLFRFYLTNVVALPPHSFVTWCSHLLSEDIGFIPKSSDVQPLGSFFSSHWNGEGVAGTSFCWWCMLTHQESPAVNTVLRNYVSLFPAPKDTALPWASSTRSWYGVILTHPIRHWPWRFRCTQCQLHHQSFNRLGRHKLWIEKGICGFLKKYTGSLCLTFSHSAAVLNPYCSLTAFCPPPSLLRCHLFTRNLSSINLPSFSPSPHPFSYLCPLLSPSCL